MEEVFWAVLAVAAFVGELLTVSFFLLFFSFGAAVAFGMAFLGFGLAAQAVGFVLATGAGALVLRPPLVHRLASRGGERYVGHRGIAGESAVVTEAIEPGGRGIVRVGNGEFWTARSLSYGERLRPGARVRVLDTDGVTALVAGMEETEGGEGL